MAKIDQLSEGARRLLGVIKGYLPWFTLLFSVVSAFFMDRSPKGSWLIIAMAAAGWIVLILFTFVGRLNPEKFTGKKRILVNAGRFGVLFLAQSIMQNSLLFALPFYVRAMTLHIGQALFLLTLLGLTAVTLWDPLYERVVMGVPIVGFLIQGVATFVALNAVLPPFGMSNYASLIISGLFTGLGLPILAWLETMPDDDDDDERRRMQKHTRRLALVCALCIPAVVLLGGARVIPAAPLRVISGGLGSALAGRGVVAVDGATPNELVCATIIGASLGIKDKLFHVWRHDGKETDRIALTIKGRSGDKGYFTYSRKRRLGAHPEGTWTCSVETQSHQHLGTFRAVVR